MSHTVLIADDSELMRRQIRKCLQDEPSIQIVGEAEDFAQAISMCRDLKPDVLLLDLHMPDDQALLPTYIKSNLPDPGSKTHVIGMSLVSDADEAVSALGQSLGAVRVLSKSAFYDDLIPAILDRK